MSVSAKVGKFLCPDCKQDLGRSVAKESNPCKSCGKRICNYCHVAQDQQCRKCKAGPAVSKPQMQTGPGKKAEKKKRFLFF